MPEQFIDTERFSKILREKILNREEKKVLISNFYGSKQEKDLTISPNCKGFGRVRHFWRSTNPDWPIDPLPIEPARKALGFGDKNLIQAQVFQIAGCNWRCWYCFVDYPLLSADPKYGSWLSTNDLVELYMEKSLRPKVIDLTGGQPDLVPEWIPWFMRSLKKVGLDKSTYLWSDDNLSSTYLWDYLSNEDIDLMLNYPHYGRVGCFKGFTEKAFSFNTNASPDLFGRQFALMGRLISLGFDIYAYATFTSPSRSNIKADMIRFIDKLQELNHYLPLRTVPLEIKRFTANADRFDKAPSGVIQNQYDAIDIWKEELQNRFTTEELKS